MTQNLDSSRTVFIHDFDGVHYPNAAIPHLHDLLGHAKAEVAVRMMPSLAYEDALELGLTSYAQTGNGMSLLERHAKTLGLDADLFQREFHFDLHKSLYASVMKSHASVFSPIAAINAHLENLRGKIRHGLVTQSCLVHWARPHLTALGRLDYFEKNAIFGFAESGFLTKAESTKPLAIAIEALNAKPDEVVFIEDSLANLKRAKELDEKILTVYTCHDHPLEAVPDYVDLQTSSLETLFSQVWQLQQPTNNAIGS